jgi:hypothetical protein
VQCGRSTTDASLLICLIDWHTLWTVFPNSVVEFHYGWLGYVSFNILKWFSHTFLHFSIIDKLWFYSHHPTTTDTILEYSTTKVSKLTRFSMTVWFILFYFIFENENKWSELTTVPTLFWIR